MQKIVSKKRRRIEGFFIKVGSHELNICSAKIMSDIIKIVKNFCSVNIVKSIFDFLRGMVQNFYECGDVL